MIIQGKRLLAMIAVGAALGIGSATPALADRGGVPNERSCGGIGKEKGDEGELFTCDDVGQDNASPKARGFGPPTPWRSTLATTHKTPGGSVFQAPGVLPFGRHRRGDLATVPGGKACRAGNDLANTARKKLTPVVLPG